MVSDILLGTLLVIFLATFGGCSVSTKRCSRQADCDTPRECCSQRFLENEAYCVPRRQLGEICMDGGFDEMMVNNTYVITCPCAVELSCVKEKWYSQDGRLLYQRNPRCREATFEQPPLEYYLGSNVIQTDQGYASPGSYGNVNAGPNAIPLVFPPYGPPPKSYANAGPQGNVKYYSGSNGNPYADSYAFQYRRK